MEEIIEEAIKDYFINLDNQRQPKIIIVNKKDYKNWIFKLSISIQNPMTFPKKLKHHNLRYRGIRVIFSKQIKRKTVIIL